MPGRALVPYDGPMPYPPRRLRCFSSPRYHVDLPAGHVFPMGKFMASAAKLVDEGAVAATQIVDPGLIADADLLRVHTPAYVESIRTAKHNPLTAKHLGLPPTVALGVRSYCAVAGTLAAARAALSDGIAANLAGGTHHSFPDRGEGFCVFNDVAVAIRALRADEPYLQVMVIDLDAHQGNGTHAIFAADPGVFTYSVHVGKNYPSRKEPGTLDVPLGRWAGGDEYFGRLEETLPAAVEKFEPDLAFYIGGADCHADDRFGQMKLTTAEMRARDERAIGLCRGWGIPTVVLYGGGYNKVAGMTAELHCQTVRVAASLIPSVGPDYG